MAAEKGFDRSPVIAKKNINHRSMENYPRTIDWHKIGQYGEALWRTTADFPLIRSLLDYAVFLDD